MDWVTSYVWYPPTAQWLCGISSLVINWLEHDADWQIAIWCCDSPVNLKPSISPWNIITKVHMWRGGGGEEEKSFGRKSCGCSFLVLGWCYSNGLPWTWDFHQLTVPHCNTQTLKQCLRTVWKHKKNILLQHDNVRPHTAMQAIELLHSPHLL